MSETGAGIDGVVAALEGAGVPVAEISAKVVALLRERPEAAVIAAFAGGLVAAMIVRRLGS